ncbi:MAG: hypothetical protein ACI959_000538 [Limisphaerales bacterium]|jgi:hypothetical protein
MNQSKLAIFVAFLCLMCSTTYAQRNCGSMDYLQQQLNEDPKRATKMDAIELHTQNAIANAAIMRSAVDGIITIPVVVHVVYNTSAENISAAQVATQIQVLNEDFRRLNSDADGTWSQAADVEIEFCLASVDPSGGATDGITRTSTSTSAFGTNDNMKFNSSGGKDAWPSSDYLNMWVCDISGGILGYAQFPGGAPATDGVVMDYQYFGTIGTSTSPFDLGRTATHEVGHWLNLRHIWGDGGCSVDDFVSDTPVSDGPNYGCAPSTVSCGTTDMVQNYMDYSDDACMNLYTAGQTARMRALFDSGGARASLLSSGGCGSGGGPSCFDGVQNGTETGVDCGGSCPACPTVCTDNEITISITLDNYPEETSWTVSSGGTTYGSGGTYGSQPDGSTVSIDLCLADGCYDFTINDAYGDGICCAYGTGSYTVSGSGVSISGGAFASSETTNFCVGGGGPTPTCSDGIQNGSETGVDCGGPDCAPCFTCSDGIQNGSETGVDCGGPDCAPCFTCSDGIQNGSETGVDCGGPDCAPCSGGGCSDVTINSNDFESGWGIWNDGGSDCRRSSNDAAYANGSRCVRLRDNTSSSVMTTDNLNLGSYEEITIDFTYVSVSMENGEDFWLQYSQDGGATYSTLVTWARGVDFSNNVRENESVVVTGTFSSTFRWRFRCDASNNGDRIYIDDVVISGCQNSAREVGPELSVVGSEASIERAQLFNDNVNVYPNPTSGDISVNFDLLESADLDIMVTDITGKVMMQYTELRDAGNHTIVLPTATLPNGIYLLHLVNTNDNVSRKFVVTK